MSWCRSSGVVGGVAVPSLVRLVSVSLHSNLLICGPGSTSKGGRQDSSKSLTSIFGSNTKFWSFATKWVRTCFGTYRFPFVASPFPRSSGSGAQGGCGTRTVFLVVGYVVGRREPLCRLVDGDQRRILGQDSRQESPSRGFEGKASLLSGGILDCRGRSQRRQQQLRERQNGIPTLLLTRGVHE